MFISCPEISIFLVKTTCETASDKLVPSLQFVPDSSTVPRYILMRESMPVRGLGVDIYNAGDWGRVRVCSKIGSGFFNISSEISVNLSKIPTLGPLRKSVSPYPDPWDHLIDQIPPPFARPPPPPPRG